MYIPSYQMHNVLNVYSKQLSQNRIGGNSKNLFQKSLTDQINLSPEGKRKATIEKVAKEILDKITHLGNQNIEEQVALKAADQEQNNQDKTKKTNRFIFNVIDDLNKKITTALSVKDKGFLMSRIDQLDEDAVEKDADI